MRPRASTVEHDIPRIVAPHEDGVEHVLHAAERRGHGHEEGRHKDERAPRADIETPEQFDGIAVRLRRLHVALTDGGDSLGMHAGGVRQDPGRPGGENTDLPAGVDPLNIRRGISLGVPLLLCLGERPLEGRPGAEHPRENIVGRAV